MDQLSDADLVMRSTRGETEAFAALVQRYAPLVHSMALSSTGHADQADDLAQEAFCKAYAHLGDIRDSNCFRSWLWGITRRVCLDRARRPVRETALPDQDFPAADDPARDAEESERRERVRMAVNELPEKYSIVVQLRHLQGMSYERIAGVLGLSTSGVSNRLAAAREMLRVKLKALAVPER